MPAAAVVALGKQQHVVAERRQQFAAERAAIGRGLRVLGPAGVPLGTVMGAGILAVYLYPRLLGARLKLGFRDVGRAEVAGLPTLGGAIVLALIVGHYVPTVHGWIGFGEKATVFELATTLLVVLGRDTRSQLARLVSRGSAVLRSRGAAS